MCAVYPTLRRHHQEVLIKAAGAFQINGSSQMLWFSSALHPEENRGELRFNPAAYLAGLADTAADKHI